MDQQATESFQRAGTPLAEVLLCVGCRAGGLLRHERMLECGACGRTYPVMADIPVMIADAAPLRGPLLDPAAARGLLAALDLPPDPVNALRLRRAAAARASLAGCPPRPLPADGAILAKLQPKPDVDGTGEAACAWHGDYLPRAMRPGEEAFASVRFHNAGSAAMTASGDGRMTVAFMWSDRHGNPVMAQDIRTPIPAPVAPGDAMTLLVRVRAPRRPGQYNLSLKMVQEGQRWLEPAFGPFPVAVHAQAAPLTLDRVRPAAAGPEEHEALLLSWLRSDGSATPRVLELGNGASPVLAGVLPYAFHVDEDLLALQFGRLRNPGAQPVCAALTDLPFPEAWFDAIALFGPLHAVDDPAALLRSLRCHLRSGGFIALFGQPVSEEGRAAEPDRFSPADWALIFRRGRVSAVDVRIGKGRLSARLTPEAQNA